MHSWIRHFLPFGLVRASQFRSELIDLGVRPALASRLALQPSTQGMLRANNLDLLPLQALAQVKTAIDIGANAGEWTAAVLRFCQPERVLCVEPDPTLAGRLRERFKKAPVTITETAAGDKTGSARFNRMSNPELNSLRQPAEGVVDLYPEPFQIKDQIDVTVQPLDAIAADLGRVSLLKIDAQGFEREILAGGREVLCRTDIVLLEVNFRPHYEGEADFYELDACMKRNGFCLANYSRPKGGKRQALFADAVYVRRES